MGFLQGAGELSELVAALEQEAGDWFGRFLIVLEIGKPSCESGEGPYDAMGEEENEAAEGGGQDEGGSEDPAAQAGESSFFFADEDEVVFRPGEGGEGEVMAIDLNGDGCAACVLLENALEIVRPTLEGRAGDATVGEIEGHIDLENGRELPGHLVGARKGDFRDHEPCVAGGGLLEAPHRFAPVEGRNPDCQPEGGEEDEGGEWDDEPAIEAAPPCW